MERYDIAIIGTGPAGIEAAITAKARNKNIVLIGREGTSQKVEKAHTVKNYLGLPSVSGVEIRQAFLNHLTDMDIAITVDRVIAVYGMGDYFAIQGSTAMYEASTVILACGVFAGKPFPGELENIGRGISYCATCDATLYKGKSVIAVGYGAKEEPEAEFLAELAEHVLYLPLYQTNLATHGNLEVAQKARPLEVARTDAGMTLRLNNGSTLEADGIFILRDSLVPTQLVPGLEVENNRIVVDRSMKTNIDGLFACGDVTGTPYQYIKAAGEGNVAALSAVSYLSQR